MSAPKHNAKSGLPTLRPARSISWLSWSSPRCKPGRSPWLGQTTASASRQCCVVSTVQVSTRLPDPSCTPPPVFWQPSSVSSARRAGQMGGSWTATRSSWRCWNRPRTGTAWTPDRRVWFVPCAPPGRGCSSRLPRLVPAGAGKTAAMRTLVRAWSDSGGQVIGLAPSAAAAAQLRDATGAPAETLAKLTWSIDRKELPEWAERIGRATLVIIDEAGMADTLSLDAAITFIVGRGGSIRLIGDDQQLAAIGAGGVLCDIQASSGAVRLTELHRFADPAEAEEGAPGARWCWRGAC
jgi:AAA domain